MRLAKVKKMSQPDLICQCFDQGIEALAKVGLIFMTHWFSDYCWIHELLLSGMS